MELLYDNARYAITETCLALTIFREELTARVFTLFTVLLFCKAFHWLVQSRVEHIEQAGWSRRTACANRSLRGVRAFCIAARRLSRGGASCA